MEKTNTTNRIFLDYASTTPVDPGVAEAMRPYLSEKFANPAALYQEGVLAKEAVKESRLLVARTLQCKAEEIIFTGSGTESDNLAIFGTLRKHWNAGFDHMVTTAIEHPAVMQAAKAFESDGGKVTYVEAGEAGIVKAEDVLRAITPKTALVSVMLANNEIGTIQPVLAIGKQIEAYRRENKARLPYFHVDASQAANYIDVSASRLGADLITFDGSKIYGPKGVGALFVKKGTELSPLMFGGSQEKGLRPATENVSGIVGFAHALSLAAEMKEVESARLESLRNYFIDEVLKRFPDALLNGSRDLRLPNNANFCFPGLDAEFAVLKMDAKGVACSAASSCRSLSHQTYSYVIEALGKPECSSSSLRFTMGRGTTKEELDRTVALLAEVVRNVQN